MKRLKLILPVLLATSLFISCGGNTDKPEDSKEMADMKNEEKFEDNNMKEKNADFVSDVVASNYAELNLAKLAMDKSANKDIKDIADKLKTDHTQFIADLKNYASSNAISVPDSATQDAMDKSAKLSKEKDFDKEWCSEMINAHEGSINKLESFSTSDPTLKDWINGALPKIKMHLAMLEEHKSKMKS